MTKLQAGILYDSFPVGQSLSRQDFIRDAVALTDPNQFHLDTQALLGLRSTAQAEKVKIERALKQKGQ